MFSITRKKNIIPLIILLFLSSKIFAQIAIGDWRTHLPYHVSTIVMATNDKIFCSSTGGLFYYNLNDNSIQTISKTDGLSDNGLAAMNWSESDQLAVLAYEDANVDIIIDNSIINVPDIMKKQIPGDKSINHIYFLDHKAYLACGFGIVVLDLKKFEITETYYIGNNGDQLKVNQISSDDTYIYAATDEGVRKAEISNPFLIDFNSWEVIDDLPVPDGSYSGIAFFNDRLFVVYNDQIASKDRVYFYNGSWNEFESYTDEDCNEIRVVGNFLIFAGNEGVHIMSEDYLFVRNYEKGKPRSAVLDDEGILWIADYGRGLIRVDAESEKKILPNGPISSIAYKMVAGKNTLYCVSGGVTATYNNVFRSGKFMKFSDQVWESHVNYDIRDLISIVVDPKDPDHVFAASWGYGLAEYRDGKPVELYNEFNSSLQNAVPGSNVIRLGGLAYDSEDNLWMTNTAVSEPISVLKSDGTWKSFKAGGLLSSYPALGEILFADDGSLWGIIPKGGGLFAMNFNGTIDNEDDDEYKLVSVVDENGSVITNEIFSFAKDKNGNIWLGTNQGILVFYSPERLFSEGSVFAKEVLVPRDDGTDYADPLLLTEKVTTIEVDGSNRKWIGTANGGAFLVSENGFKQIHNFNTGNSPILSNSILDICVEGVTGEVFFGTDKGLISFRGDATEGAKNYSDVKVFPNPVRENYYGPVAISGLVAETTVKITDISGTIENEIQSFGGEAIWDGTNFKGERVATGTYLIFLANKDATIAHVTKILFIH